MRTEARGSGVPCGERGGCGVGCGGSTQPPRGASATTRRLVRQSRSARGLVSTCHRALSPRSSHAEPHHAATAAESVVAPRHVHLTPASVPPAPRSSHQAQVSASRPPFRTRKRAGHFFFCVQFLCLPKCWDVEVSMVFVYFLLFDLSFVLLYN